LKSPIQAIVCGLVFFMSTNAVAETSADVFEEMDSRKRASFNGIDNYSVMKTTMGQCTLEHFEKESTASLDGRGAVQYMRLVPISEVATRRSPGAHLANASAEELDAAATAVRQAPSIDQTIRSELASAGLPAGFVFMLTNPPTDKPWLSPMPGDMMGNYAAMLEGAAQGKRQDATEKSQAEEETRTDPLAAVAAQTRIVGRETLRDRLVIRLVADNLNHTQVSNGQEFTMNTLHLWVDAEKYVPLKMQIDGSATEGQEARALRIEREDMGYRSVAGCGSMYEPLRTVMRISGILSEQEQAQMAEAQAQMAQLEAQLASMPAMQRDMIMRQMGPQMETFRSMASGQGIEVVALVTGMVCNAGLPSDKEYLQTTPGVSMGACIGFGE
jgi:hypothetical protein